MHHPTLQRLEELMHIRDLSPRTIKAYNGQVKQFLRYVDKPIDDLEPNDVRRFMVHLKIERELATSTIHQALAAVRLFYVDTLGLDWNYKHFRCHSRRRKLPSVFSHREIGDLFDATESIKFRAIFMAMYSAGLRLNESTHLQPRDIDSGQMRIHVRGGKGRKDRYTILSTVLLETLRTYWKSERPKQWLFFGTNKDQPINNRTVQRRFAQARDRAGIKKAVTPHSLRHSFATHLLEAGTNIRYIQELLGHKSIQSTLIYLKVTPQSINAVTSPLDLMGR